MISGYKTMRILKYLKQVRYFLPLKRLRPFNENYYKNKAHLSIDCDLRITRLDSMAASISKSRHEGGWFFNNLKIDTNYPTVLNRPPKSENDGLFNRFFFPFIDHLKTIFQ